MNRERNNDRPREREMSVPAISIVLSVGLSASAMTDGTALLMPHGPQPSNIESIQS